jgi:hypothetical protein
MIKYNKKECLRKADQEQGKKPEKNVENFIFCKTDEMKN